MKHHLFLLILTTLSIAVQLSAQTDSQRHKDKKAQSSYVTATHDSLNRLGAELLRRVDAQKLYAEIYSPEHIVELRRGGVDEDDHTFGLGCDAGRFYKHFFQPASGFGLYSETSGTYCISAVAWARFSDDELTWSGAISSYDYSPTAKLHSYLRLGHVAHLVGDMAQPDHVHLEPHPLSFITDYEGWVVDNWSDIAPDIKKLSPRKRAIMEDHLREMADVTYPLSSFFGGVLRRDVNNPIDQSTELARMFKVGYLFQWTLNNHVEVDPDTTPLGDWDGTYDSDDNFWETTAESGYGDSGNFTIEDISDAIPAEFKNVANTERRKLGYFYATKLLPLAVEYIAGLYEHFFEIVNHPPYVSKVSVSKNDKCIYAKQWQNIFTGEKLEKRELVDVCSTLPSDRMLTPGEKIEIQIEFGDSENDPNEMIQDVDVKLGTLSIAGLLINDRLWRAEFVIPIDGSLVGDQLLTINARDKHEHYSVRNELGDRLDVLPETPAKAERVIPYNWTGYEVGVDQNHHILIDNKNVDIAFIIDDTGSMGEEITGVRAALLEHLKTYDPNSGTVFQLTTFKDGVSERAPTKDLALIQSQVAALVATGGDDCPEASVEAINQVKAKIKNNGRAFIATDAAPHSGLDISATIKDLRAKGIRVDVVLSGDCFASLAANTSPNDSPGQQNDANSFSSEETAAGSAIESFSLMAQQTGGVFAYIPEVNTSNITNRQRYQNTIFNVVQGGLTHSLLFVQPALGPKGCVMNVTITSASTNFQPGTILSFDGGGIAVENLSIVSPTKLQATINISASAASGFRDLTAITNSGGISETAKGIGAFEVVAAPGTPTITSISPPSGEVGQALTVIINGVNTHLSNASVINLGTGIVVSNVTTISPTTVQANVVISNAAVIGFRDVRVTTGSEVAFETVTGPFFVSPVGLAVPEIASVSPAAGGSGTELTFTITGRNTNFSNGASAISFSKSGVEILNTTVESSTSIRATLRINSDAPLGFRDVRVSTGPEIAVLLNGFNVISTAGPIVYAGQALDDDCTGASCGDGDGIPESDERVELAIRLTNQGAQTTTGVRATISTTAPEITIIDNNETWPDIAGGATVISSSSFSFSVDHDLVTTKTVNFNIVVMANNGGPWNLTFQITISPKNTVADLLADRVFLRTGPNSGAEVTNPVVGQRYYIHFDWRNTGATAANGFRFEIRFNGSVIYGFSSANAPGNSIHNSYGPSPVVWPAGGGVISGALDVHNQVTEAAKNNNAAFRTFGYQSFDDFDFSAQVRSIENFNNNGGADLCFVYGYQDDRHYYYVMFNRGLNETRVYKVRDLERILIGDLGTFTIPDNNYHTVRLLRRSGNLQVYWDNVLLGGTSNDHEYGAGGIGVGSFNDTGIFDDICVKLPGGSTCLVSDNFEDGNANGWLPLNLSHWDVFTDGGDRGYRINDTNYENLEYLRLGEYSLIALTGQADLVAQRIYLRNSAGTEVDVPVAGQSYTVSFQWQNAGTAVANNIPVEVRLNGNVLCTANVTANPGDTKITSCPTPVTFNPGNYFFESTVDVGNLITESNENNNSTSRTIIVPDTCVPTTCTGPALFPVPQGATVIGTPITGRTGSMICIDIRMQNNAQPVDAFGFQMQVNPGQLAFVNAVAGDLTTGFTSVNAIESPAGSGRIICGGFGTTAIPANRSGVLIRLCFTVTCAANESSLITLNSLSDDVAGMNTCCNTFACATCESNGDVNNDRSLSPGDALCAFNIYLNGGRLTTACDIPSFTCEVTAADVNCDGAVTPSDALAIFTRYLQGGLPQHCFAKTVLAKSSGAPYRLALKQSQMILSGNTSEELLKLTLRIDNPEGLSAMGFRLSYPADKVEPLAVQRTALTAKWVKLEGQSLWPGQMIIGGYDPEALPNSGAADLLEVLFKVKAQPVRAEEFGLSELIDDLAEAIVLTGEAEELVAGGVPKAFQLHQSYPNPFGAAQGNLATIRFEVPGSDAVKMELAIYNLAGQLVRQLLTGVRAPGAFEITWDGNDETGNPTPSGTYLYRLRAGDHVASKSLVLVR